VTHQPPPALELAGNLEYPNLNIADLNARLENLSPRLHDCWDSIAINDHNHLALATNRREGRQWWGMLFGAKLLRQKEVERLFNIYHSFNVNGLIIYQ